MPDHEVTTLFILCNKLNRFTHFNEVLSYQGLRVALQIKNGLCTYIQGVFTFILILFAHEKEIKFEAHYISVEIEWKWIYQKSLVVQLI